MGALRSFFDGRAAPFFYWRNIMQKRSKYLAHGALIAAMYVALTHLQNILIPGSATWAIQFRLSEALCILAFFTPAAIPGLSAGCFLFNLTYSAALPLDALVGTLATVFACGGMYLTRRFVWRGIPFLGLALPALSNSLLVGWELTAYIGGAFAVNAVYVAIGELATLYTLGLLLYTAIKKRGLHIRLFGEDAC